MPYTALIGPDVKPSHVIQVTKNAGWISVGFLDKELKEYLLYSFKVLGNERLFFQWQFTESLPRAKVKAMVL